MEVHNASTIERKKIIMATDYIRFVLRETLKSSENRKEDKIFSYLKMAMHEIDRYYDEKSGNNSFKPE